MGAATVGWLTAAAAEPGPPSSPEQGVLLLRNGHTIEGKISRVGDLYYVALPNGEIRVRAGDVDFACRDLEDGYRKKRAAIQSGDVYDHLRLAQWCLRHELLGHAGRELADALAAQPDHPMIAVLERRLKLALERPKKPPHDDAPTEHTSLPEDLERLVRGMPPGTVETFAQTIQPLLVNHCTAAACHGPGATAEFRLLRLPIDRPPSRLTTQRNLHATLQWIDQEQPAASRLLAAPIRPHGTAQTAVFTSRQLGQYQRIVDWVHQVAARPASKAPATVTPQQKPPVRAMPAESAGFLFAEPAASPAVDQRPAAEPTVGDPFGKTFPRHPEEPGTPYVPIDPFDPEIFNRRYFPAR